jgi:hypothetical protein
MPFYGSKAFRELKITMFIRKSFLEESKFDQAAIAIAHELSHVVLESIGHPLRGCEKAVDLTAMLLGFCQLYATGSYKEERSRNSTRYRTLGYLSPEEVALANQILAPGRSRINVIQFLLVRRKALVLALLVVGIIGSLAAKELYGAWEMHKTLLAAQAKVLKQNYDTHPPAPAAQSRGIPPLFKADTVNIAVSASKDGKLRMVYGGWDSRRSSRRAFDGSCQAPAVRSAGPSVTCNIGRKGGPLSPHRYASREVLLGPVDEA